MFLNKRGQLNGPTKTFSKEGEILEEGEYLDGKKQ